MGKIIQFPERNRRDADAKRLLRIADEIDAVILRQPRQRRDRSPRYGGLNRSPFGDADAPYRAEDLALGRLREGAEAAGGDRVSRA